MDEKEEVEGGGNPTLALGTALPSPQPKEQVVEREERRLETVEDLERQVKEWAEDSFALRELVEWMMGNERVRRMLRREGMEMVSLTLPSPKGGGE